MLKVNLKYYQNYTYIVKFMLGLYLLHNFKTFNFANFEDISKLNFQGI